MSIARTPRLLLRHITLEDAPFLLELMNQPAYHRFIGDRGLRDMAGTRDYIQAKFIDSYEKHGYGLYAAALHGEPTPVGICGLVRRDHLPHPDIGFAFLSAYWSQGLATEAALAILDYARGVLKLPELLAITNLDNVASLRVLEKIGFRWQKTIEAPDGKNLLNLLSVLL